MIAMAKGLDPEARSRGAVVLLGGLLRAAGRGVPSQPAHCDRAGRGFRMECERTYAGHLELG
jgi:hypothetical protein